MNIIEFAKNELEIAGMFDKDSDYNGMIGDAVMELIKVFAEQGHSGYSASIVSNIFNMLSKWKPITPLSGNDDEWNRCSSVEDSPYWQNKRNSAVFKDGKEGKPYYVDAYRLRTPDGNCYGGSLYTKDGRHISRSRCYIKDFSQMPTITINVMEAEGATGAWYTWVEDETQLEELAKYYDFDLVSA